MNEEYTCSNVILILNCTYVVCYCHDNHFGNYLFRKTSTGGCVKYLNLTRKKKLNVRMCIDNIENA
jgi:hypothetical protein